MNPYEVASLVNPTIQRDWRESNSGPHAAGLDYSLTRAFFRFVNTVDRVSLRRTR